jgi:hypothetical protein
LRKFIQIPEVLPTEGLPAAGITDDANSLYNSVSLLAVTKFTWRHNSGAQAGRNCDNLSAAVPPLLRLSLAQFFVLQGCL